MKGKRTAIGWSGIKKVAYLFVCVGARRPMYLANFRQSMVQLDEEVNSESVVSPTWF